MEQQSPVFIRKAHPEDYDSVMEIGDVYGGKDYMWSKYHSFIRDSTIYPLVAEVDGKVVGFYMYHVLDGGITAIKRGGRVNKSFRGRGIFHELSDALEEHSKTLWPGVVYENVATNDLVDRASHEYKDKGFVEVSRKRILNMVYNVNDFKRIKEGEKLPQVSEMTNDDLRLLFSQDDVITKLFPQRRIFNFFIGYRPLEANIRYLVNDTAHAYATVSSSSSTTIMEPSQNDHKGRIDIFHTGMLEKIEIVSFSHHYAIRDGLAYEIDIYSRDGFDYASLEGHIRRHVESISKLCSGKGVLMFTFGSNVDENKVLSCLNSHGIREFLSVPEKMKVLYERQV